MNENNINGQQDGRINVRIENYTGTAPIRIIYREDSPRVELKTIQAKEPEAFNIEGIITAPADWLEKRAREFDHLNARVDVYREQGTLKLIINERNCAPGLEATDVEDHYNGEILDNYRSRSTVTGTIQMTDIFRKLRINDDEAWWDPQKLSAFFRLYRSIFPSAEDNMVLVSTLKNIKAKMNTEYEKAKDTYTGSRTEHYQMTVDHNLPKNFDICIPIFKGSKAEKYNVEFDVDIIDGKLLLKLVSPAINDEVEGARDQIIDSELKRICEMAEDLVIIEK